MPFNIAFLAAGPLITAQQTAANSNTNLLDAPILSKFVTFLVGGLVTLSIQYYFYNKSRKKAAIDLVLAWGKERQDSWAYAIEFAASLDPDREMNRAAMFEQTRALWDVAPIKNLSCQSSENRMNQWELAQQCLREGHDLAPGPPPDGERVLGREDVAKIRWLVVSYLNLLDGILLGWKCGVVDDQIIVQLFEPLVRSSHRFPARLFLLRDAGENTVPRVCFPATVAFFKKVIKKKHHETQKVEKRQIADWYFD